MIISGEKIIFSELPRSGLFTLYSIVYFCVGKMLSERVLTKKTSIVLGILGLALSIGESILGVKAYGYILDGVNGSFPTIGALCMSIAIFNCLHLIHLNEKSKKVINYLSPCVLGVYIFHLQIMKWLRQFGAFSILTLGQSILMSVFVYALCVLISKIFDAIPYANKLIKI